MDKLEMAWNALHHWQDVAALYEAENANQVALSDSLRLRIDQLKDEAEVAEKILAAEVENVSIGEAAEAEAAIRLDEQRKCSDELRADLTALRVKVQATKDILQQDGAYFDRNPDALVVAALVALGE